MQLPSVLRTTVALLSLCTLAQAGSPSSSRSSRKRGADRSNQSSPYPLSGSNTPAASDAPSPLLYNITDPEMNRTLLRIFWDRCNAVNASRQPYLHVVRDPNIFQLHKSHNNIIGAYVQIMVLVSPDLKHAHSVLETLLEPAISIAEYNMLHDLFSERGMLIQQDYGTDGKILYNHFYFHGITVQDFVEHRDNWPSIIRYYIKELRKKSKFGQEQ